MKITIHETPIPQKRHRTKVIGRRLKMYDPLSKEKEHIRFVLAKIISKPAGSREIDEEALYLRYKDFYHVSFVFTFPIPKSDRKALRKAKLNGLKHVQTPDLDNCEKFYLDCLTGVAFSDDKKVVKLQSEKKWGIEGKIEIDILGFNEVKDE